jgi:hypothetical protein
MFIMLEQIRGRARGKDRVGLSRGWNSRLHYFIAGRVWHCCGSQRFGIIWGMLPHFHFLVLVSTSFLNYDLRSHQHSILTDLLFVGTEATNSHRKSAD